ncbi:general odorant-binding protein lush [Cylas formicarius]|uniref:general odorant-binding protein lush n=1 Tax=Cylas formicarius TaxID=197179 RepID=UPI0029584A82|nr:general odorant-binding protein lush [Cylas formicarius]
MILRESNLMLLFIVCVCNHDVAFAAMSEKQVVAAVRLVRNMCLPKTKALPEEIDKMHVGDWDIGHNTMCYMQCALNQYKLIGKNNKLDMAQAEQQTKQLPPSLKAYTDRCLQVCKDSAVTLDDKCVAGYEISKCMYFCDPEKYFLP